MSPDGSTKPLPEEKLLNLIREKGATSGATSASTQAAGADVSVIARNDTKLRRGQFQWLKLAITGLSIVLVIESISLIIQVTRPLPSVKAPAVTLTHPSESVPSVVPPVEIPSLSTVISRPLFVGSANINPAAVAPAAKSGPSESAKLLAARLTLMGIMAGNPAQAIIEDSQTKKTYFVSPGQPVVEGAVLKQVLENRVILDLQGETIELTL